MRNAVKIRTYDCMQPQPLMWEATGEADVTLTTSMRYKTFHLSHRWFQAMVYWKVNLQNKHWLLVKWMYSYELVIFMREPRCGAYPYSIFNHGWWRIMSLNGYLPHKYGENKTSFMYCNVFLASIDLERPRMASRDIVICLQHLSQNINLNTQSVCPLICPLCTASVLKLRGWNFASSLETTLGWFYATQCRVGLAMAADCKFQVNFIFLFLASDDLGGRFNSK